MSETINGKWLTDKDDNKIAPKTFVGQVLSDDGTKNLNTIIDEIKAGGTSPVEVTDARVGVDNTTYTTLKGRLDSEYKKLTALADESLKFDNFAPVIGGSISSYPTRVNMSKYVYLGYDSTVVFEDMQDLSFGTDYMINIDVLNSEGTRIYNSGWVSRSSLGKYFVEKGQGIKVSTKYYPTEVDTSSQSAVTNIVNAVKAYSNVGINIKNIESNVEALECVGWTIPSGMPIKDISKVGRVDLGSLNWSLHSTIANLYVANAVDMLGMKVFANSEVANWYCNGYETISGSKVNTTTDKVCSCVNKVSIMIRDTKYSSDLAFKNAMQGVYLYYELATPTTYKDGKEKTESLTHNVDDIEYLGWSVPSEMPIQNYKDANGVFHQRVGRVDLDSLEWVKDTDYYSTSILFKREYGTTSNGYHYSYENKLSWGSFSSATDKVFHIDSNLKLYIKDSSGAPNGYLYYELATEKTYNDGEEAGLELGETTGTAYEGSKGKAVTDLVGNATLSTTNKTVTGAINELKTNFQAGVDGIYNAVVAQGTTPSSKSQSDVQASIGTLATNKYNAGNTAGQATGKANYEPKSISATNAGSVTVKNAVGTTVLTSTITNSYDAGNTAGQNTVKATTSTTTGSWDGATYTATSTDGYKGSSASTTLTTKSATSITPSLSSQTLFTSGQRVYFSGNYTLNAVSSLRGVKYYKQISDTQISAKATCTVSCSCDAGQYIIFNVLGEYGGGMEWIKITGIPSGFTRIPFDTVEGNTTSPNNLERMYQTVKYDTSYSTGSKIFVLRRESGSGSSNFVFTNSSSITDQKYVSISYFVLG